MKIFVTGATGFIGSHLCRRLAEEGHHLTVLLRTPEKRHQLPGGITILNGDLTLFKNRQLVLPAFDYVVHLAGAVFAKSADEYYEVNCEAVKDLITSLKNQDWQLKRFLFASSLAAAGPSNGERPLTESDSLNPIDPYGEAKKAAEEWLQSQTIPSTSFRPSIVLGSGDENTLTLFKMAKRGIGIKIAGHKQQISFVDVDDVVDGIIRMMTTEGEKHQKYFVSHPDKITLPDLWSKIGEVLGKKVRLVPVPKFILFLLMLISSLIFKVLPFKNQLDYKQYRQMTAPAFVCSGDKLRLELGWEPGFGLEASLQKAIDGYRQIGKL